MKKDCIPYLIGFSPILEHEETNEIYIFIDVQYGMAKRETLQIHCDSDRDALDTYQKLKACYIMMRLQTIMQLQKANLNKSVPSYGIS